LGIASEDVAMAAAGARVWRLMGVVLSNGCGC
jgi:hypothetical protein